MPIKQTPLVDFDFEQYWAYLFDARTAEQIVVEFELEDDGYFGVSEWLGHVEAETCPYRPMTAIVEAWQEHHHEATRSLQEAIRRRGYEDYLSGAGDW